MRRNVSVLVHTDGLGRGLRASVHTPNNMRAVCLAQTADSVLRIKHLELLWAAQTAAYPRCSPKELKMHIPYG